jgi:hypothetical protein
MEALASLAAVVSLIGNVILGLWCCFWGSKRKLALKLLAGWIVVTAMVMPVVFVAGSIEPVPFLGHVLAWSYYSIGVALFILFARMVISSDHIKNS